MIFIKVDFCLLNVLELEIALGETGMCLHLFELKGVLAFSLVPLFILSALLVIQGLLKLDQVLLLILDTSMILTFQVI